MANKPYLQLPRTISLIGIQRQPILPSFTKFFSTFESSLQKPNLDQSDHAFCCHNRENIIKKAVIARPTTLSTPLYYRQLSFNTETGHFYSMHPIRPNKCPSINSMREPNFIIRRYNSNSFIKSVLEQVKKDIENQPELKKAMEDMRHSAQKQRSNSEQLKLTMSKNLNFVLTNVTELSKKIRALYASISLQLGQIMERSDFSGKYLKHIRIVISHIGIGGKFVFDKISSLSEYWKDDPASEKQAAEWRRSQAIRRYQKEQEAQRTQSQDSGVGESKSEPEQSTETDPPIENSLILSKTSAWDRFGTRLKDMPFLQSFYENAILEKLFGETEIAASIREMKIVDSSFKFPEFMDMVQEVVAPHLVQCFLDGDQDSLKIHCGDAAYNAAITSINERNAMKVSLDPTILRFNNIDLIGAKRVEDDTPWFIFSFTTQQINCLRDKKGNVVSGGIDDIRDVLYSIALTKHPEPDIIGLLHPWMIKEFAILGSTPSW